MISLTKSRSSTIYTAVPNGALFKATRLILAHGQALRVGRKGRIVQGSGTEVQGKALPPDTPLYMYLAFQNVHGAANRPGLDLQAPKAVVDTHYNTTRLDRCVCFAATHRGAWGISFLSNPVYSVSTRPPSTVSPVQTVQM